MAKLYINGTLAPIAKPAEVDFDPVRGLIVNQEHHGAGPDSLAGLANYYTAHRIAFKWKRGVVSTISATYSGGQGGIPDTPQVNYELLGNEIQKTIYESPMALSAEQLYPGILNDVRYGWRLLNDNDKKGEQDHYHAIADENPEAAMYYTNLLGFLKRNQTHWPYGQYVLKRSTSISNFYNGNIDGEGYVGRVISTETLLAWCHDMPPVTSQKISSIPGTAHNGYAWGWRQLPSRMVTSAQNRVELSTEWWLEEWSTQLYGDLV